MKKTGIIVVSIVALVIAWILANSFLSNSAHAQANTEVVLIVCDAFAGGANIQVVSSSSSAGAPVVKVFPANPNECAQELADVLSSGFKMTGHKVTDSSLLYYTLE